MVILEKLPSPLAARSILEYIKSDAAKSCSGWFIGKCLDQLFGDPKYTTQLKHMTRLDEDLDNSKLHSPNKLKAAIEWEHMNTRIFHAEMGICHKYQLMQAILSNDNSIERRHEASQLRNGILDSNSGVLSNLYVINQVLVGGRARNRTKKGLLEIWSEGIYNNMSINQMSAKIFQDYVDKFMTKAAVLQLKGILLFTAANTNSRFCLNQLELFEHNLTSQIEIMEKSVPTYLKYLSDPDEKHAFNLRPVFDFKGAPFVRRQGSSNKLKYDFFCGNSEAGKWVFKKSPEFDKNGSLLISGSSKERYGKYYYMSVSANNTLECVSQECRATPFCVIPLHFIEDKMKIIIYKSNSKPEDKQFLGNDLKFINEDVGTEFTLSFCDVLLDKTVNVETMV